MTVKSTIFSGGPPVARLSTSVQAPSCSTKQECNTLILEDLDQVCNGHHVHNDAPLPLGDTKNNIVIYNGGAGSRLCSKACSVEFCLEAGKVLSQLIHREPAHQISRELWHVLNEYNPCARVLVARPVTPVPSIAGLPIFAAAEFVAIYCSETAATLGSAVSVVRQRKSAVLAR